MRTKKSFGNWPAWTHTHLKHFQKIGDDTSGLKLRLPWFGPGKKTNQLIYSATNVHNKTTTPKIRIMWKVTARKPKVHSLINFCTGWLLAAWSFQCKLRLTSSHIPLSTSLPFLIKAVLYKILNGMLWVFNNCWLKPKDRDESDIAEMTGDHQQTHHHSWTHPKWKWPITFEFPFMC